MKLKRCCAAILAGTLCLSGLGGCSSSGQKQDTGKETVQDTEENDLEDEDSNDEDLQKVPDMYKPSDLVMESEDQYEYPYLGLNFTVPQSLLDAMDNKEVAMLNEAMGRDDDSQIDYGFFSWSIMTKEQLNAEVESQGTGYYDWADGLERIGVLGVYHSGQLENLDKLTKCSEHKEIGKSEDGEYTYYISTNPDADPALTEAVGQIKAEITEMMPLEDAENSSSDVVNLGEFTVQDINGQSYTQDMFKDYELTMINVFATWCSPCINEIPDLQKLSEEMAGEGVAVAGIVMDASDGFGNAVDETVEKAKVLAERTKAAYPFLIPDAGNLNGRLEGIDAVPETFFVDKNGTIVGQTYTGSRSLDEWKSIVQETLNGMQGEGD